LINNLCYSTASFMNDSDLRWICYPPHHGCGNLVFKLENVGVERLCTPMDSTLTRKVVGKGHSAIVLIGIVNGTVRAIKIRRRDSKRISLYNEGKLLEVASRGGVAPRPFYFDDDIIVMDYIEGPHLEEALRNDPVYAVRESIRATRTLDDLGILHLELRRPWKHVRFTSWNGKAVILDYESASTGCGNVVKIVSGLLTRFDSGLVFLRKHSGLFSRYYSECSREIYEDILSIVLEFVEHHAYLG